MIISHHARLRQAQRNLSDDEIEFVLMHGEELHSGGALHIFLGRRNLLQDRNSKRQYAHLEGTVLVLSDSEQDSTLITVYRNRQALRMIKAKAKHHRVSRHIRAEWQPQPSFQQYAA